MARRCHEIEAAGGRTWRQPCAVSWACTLADIAAWRQTASAWVAQAEREAVTWDQMVWVAQMRARLEYLKQDIPFRWADRVRDYLLIAQQTSCALQGHAWTGPHPEPVEPEPEVVEPEVVEPEVVEPEVVEPEVVEPEEDDDDDGGWELPSLPGWPGLPEWPFSWPKIPAWVWWVAGAILVIWLFGGSEGTRQAARRYQERRRKRRRKR